MEVDQIANHLKFINCNGVTFNLEERLNLELALAKLQNDFNFEEILLWGKVTGNKFSILIFIGVVNDYYVAVALTYVGSPEFPQKNYFWCTSSSWVFASLPKYLNHLKNTFD